MRKRRGMLLLLLAAVGGVVAWVKQRGGSTAKAPAGDPFMSPAAPPPPRAAEAVPTPTTEQTEAEPEPASVRPPDTPVAAETGDLDPLPGPPKGPFTSPPEGPADDLKRISGIGPKLEAMLNDEGITTFAQLAALDDAAVDALQARLPQFPGRIRRDNWVEQARRLSQQT